MDKKSIHFTLKSYDLETDIYIWTDENGCLWYRNGNGKSFIEVFIQEFETGDLIKKWLK